MMAIIPADKLPLLVTAATGARAHYLPVFQAARDKRIRLAMFVDPTETVNPAELAASGPPIMAIVSDDPPAPGHARGPFQWRCTATLVTLAKSLIVHAGGGKAEHYAEGVRQAEQFGFCTYVETDILQLMIWAKRFDFEHTLLIGPFLDLSAHATSGRTVH